MEAELIDQWRAMLGVIPGTLDSLDRDLSLDAANASLPRGEGRAARREADSLRVRWLEAEVAARIPNTSPMQSPSMARSNAGQFNSWPGAIHSEPAVRSVNGYRARVLPEES